jgi:UDP-N-acetylglucosamine:LPS N-acetylglucosamine transferase
MGVRQHILLVASSGGHLAHLLTLRPWWQHHPRTWVTFDTPDARSQLQGERVVFAHFPTTRNVPNLLRNGVLAERVMKRVRPTLVVSTGAAVAIPFFVLARVRSCPSIYLEVFDRIDSRTVTGRVCRPLATEFLVQWEAQSRLYKGSRLIGPLL